MKIFKQLFIILGINLVGEALSQFLNLPIPGSIVGMILLLVLLFSGLIKEKHIRETADFMLQNMGFFFIPAGVGVMVSYHSLKGHYAETVLVIILSTIVVIAVTALATELFIKIKERRNGHSD
ncbi:MAG: CidA/LrgA family protein [Bacteroidales bacterium]